jgi:hypothetical protein
MINEYGTAGGIYIGWGNSEKSCLRATFFTKNSTRADLLSNPSHRGEKPATNRLRYGKDQKYKFKLSYLELLCGESVYCIQYKKVDHHLMKTAIL